MMQTLVLTSTALMTVLAFGLGIFSLTRNPKSAVIRLWFLLSLAITIWGFGLLMILISQTNEPAVAFYSKLLHFGAAFIPILFFHFVLVFVYHHQDKNKKRLLILGYVLAAVFAALSWTKLIVVGAAPVSVFALWVLVGSFYPLFLLYFWFFVLAAIYFLYQGYRQSDGVIRRKIFYILIAALIGFVGGGSNFLTNLTGIYPYGQFFVWLYPVLITYGIFIGEIKIKF